ETAAPKPAPAAVDRQPVAERPSRFARAEIASNTEGEDESKAEAAADEPAMPTDVAAAPADARPEAPVKVAIQPQPTAAPLQPAQAPAQIAAVLAASPRDAAPAARAEAAE